MRRRITLATIIPFALLALSEAHPSHASTDPSLLKLLKEAISSVAGFEDRFDARVWLLDMSRRLEAFVPEPRTRMEMLKQIHYGARRVGIGPELVLAVVEVESHFNE